MRRRYKWKRGEGDSEDGREEKETVKMEERRRRQ